jgi:AcrR family transcriptional regulator
VTKPDSKTALLDAAEKLFAEKGFDGATIQDLAKAADVNVSLVSYYFGGKEGLYAGVIHRFREDKILRSANMLTEAESADEFRFKLKLWMEYFLESHASNSYLSTIVLRDCMMRRPETEEAFKQSVMQGFDILKSFIAAAQKKHFIQKLFKAEILTEHLIGSLIEVVRMDPLRKIYFKRSFLDPQDRKEIIQHILEVHMHGFMAQEARK